MVCFPAMSVTMMDIAKDLNVSVATVSKVLRGKGKISGTMRRRVLRRAKALNYQMNWVARSLVTRRTYTIGLLLPEFTHPFFAEIAKAVAQVVRLHGYHVIISYFEEDPELEASEADSLLARQVDGLIIATAQPAGQFDLFERIQARKVPYVLIDRPVSALRAAFVGANNVAIGKLGAEHLLARGCRRIAHLRGPKVVIADARCEGYTQVLAKRGLKMPPGYITSGGYQDGTGHDAMRQLLRLFPLPDGVFCFNDAVAIGAMKAILEAGLGIPKDIAVVGAGNVLYTDMLTVPLTTVDQGTLAIGAKAAELLIERIEAKRAMLPKNILITPKLIRREST
jgi:LacI family transcriptional regulator